MNILFWSGIVITWLLTLYIAWDISRFEEKPVYKKLGKSYRIVLGPKGSNPCNLCCFSREECRSIVNNDNLMACHCEFIKEPYYCKEVKWN